jgi:uncharacterized protein YciW
VHEIPPREKVYDEFHIGVGYSAQEMTEFVKHFDQPLVLQQKHHDSAISRKRRMVDRVAAAAGVLQRQ